MLGRSKGGRGGGVTGGGVEGAKVAAIFDGSFSFVGEAEERAIDHECEHGLRLNLRSLSCVAAELGVGVVKEGRALGSDEKAVLGGDRRIWARERVDTNLFEGVAVKFVLAALLEAGESVFEKVSDEFFAGSGIELCQALA